MSGDWLSNYIAWGEQQFGLSHTTITQGLDCSEDFFERNNAQQTSAPTAKLPKPPKIIEEVLENPPALQEDDKALKRALLEQEAKWTDQ